MRKRRCNFGTGSNTKKISVIVAAYNASRFLDETLASIFSQTMNSEDFEVIVVNDGSTDDTGEKLADWKKREANLVTLSRENGGPSSARNAGLEVATGEFVFFFDADDLLEPTALERLYEAGRGSDLVIAKYDIFTEEKRSTVRELDQLVKKEEIDRTDEGILRTFALWNKLFRRSVIEEHCLRFRPVSYSEDGVFLMEFLGKCGSITGLDQVVMRYRRFSESGAITASVTKEKISDYQAAHHLMLETIRGWGVEGLPQKLLRKELRILLDRFYSHFWEMDKETRSVLAKVVREELKELETEGLAILEKDFPYFPVRAVPETEEEVTGRAWFTAALWESEEENFIETLKSLAKQNLIHMRIVVPESTRELVRESGEERGNIFYQEAESEREFYERVLEEAETPYITFCSEKFHYVGNAFRTAFKRLHGTADFVSEVVYNRIGGELQPNFYNQISAKRWKAGGKLEELDTLHNKFFRTDWVKRIGGFRQLSDCWRLGRGVFHWDGSLEWKGEAEAFVDFVATKETLPKIEEVLDRGVNLNNQGIDLNSPQFLYSAAESGVKFRTLPQGKGFRKWEKAWRKTQEKPLKNQVAFVSIRSNGKLDGNLQALYQQVRGKKVVYSCKLPHSDRAAVRMIKTIFSSRVIVTDDYLKYLRWFPLRPEQRVVQVWHACGAFKKFGQRGTSLALAEDRATHAQYNLVCISGEGVRGVYADAFDVSWEKVRALGVPRTDALFSQEKIEETRERVLRAHPELRGQRVILYAPTFRGSGQCNPPIDWKALAQGLPEGTTLLVCPHPIVKEKIVKGKFRNVREVRDFSTNDYMVVGDALVTDYSSVIFEFALMGKPIAFYCWDEAEYDRGFYLRYPEDLPGEVCRTQEELEKFLKNPGEGGEKLSAWVEKYMGACDGHSCERIARVVEGALK